MNIFKKLAIGLSVGAAFASSTAFANLLTNGDFETGDATGWTVAGGFTGVVGSGFDGYSTGVGNFFAALGSVGGLGSFTQTIPTIAGGTYTFSFDYGSDGALPNEFNALFDGVSVFHTINDTSSTQPGLITESFTVTASSASTNIEFFGQNDPAYQALDNVSVVQVPEPASLALLGIGLAGLGFSRRKGV